MATRKKPARRLRRLKPIQADGRGVIRITVGKDAEVYDVTTFAAYSGEATGVTLHKHSDGKVRHVCLHPDPEQCTCSCEWGTYGSNEKFCKHVCALMAMAKRGWLPLPVEDYQMAHTED